jgi:hypothetical protein
MREVAVVVRALTALLGQVLHGPAGAPASQTDRAADLAAIDKPARVQHVGNRRAPRFGPVDEQRPPDHHAD